MKLQIFGIVAGVSIENFQGGSQQRKYAFSIITSQNFRVLYPFFSTNAYFHTSVQFADTYVQQLRN